MPRTIRTQRDFEAYERERDWQPEPDPKEPQIEPLPVIEEYVLDHYPGMNTWGLWTKDKKTLLKQASLEDIMEFLEGWEE
jgi:hypothetical protein